MQETIAVIKNKTKVTNKEVLISLLNILISEKYSFNSSKEIAQAIESKFNAVVSVDLIEELWIEGREIDDIYYQTKNLNLYQ